MILDCVLTSVNENELYLDFIPIFIKTWNKLYPSVDVKIILIAYSIPEKYVCYKNNLILFEPIENVKTSFTAQFIRLLYPCLLSYENGVLITDMDMLPMNKNYYTEHIKLYENNKFIYYRHNKLFNQKQLAMCYNVATPKTWNDIFEVNNENDIINILKDISSKNKISGGHGGAGWCLDQLFLYENVTEWNKKTDAFVCLKEDQTKFRRLERYSFIEQNNDNTITNNISNGIYSDYHCARPMSKYSDINYKIYDLL